MQSAMGTQNEDTLLNLGRGRKCVLMETSGREAISVVMRLRRVSQAEHTTCAKACMCEGRWVLEECQVLLWFLHKRVTSSELL